MQAAARTYQDESARRAPGPRALPKPTSPPAAPPAPKQRRFAQADAELILDIAPRLRLTEFRLVLTIQLLCGGQWDKFAVSVAYLAAKIDRDTSQTRRAIADLLAIGLLQLRPAPLKNTYYASFAPVEEWPTIVQRLVARKGQGSSRSPKPTSGGGSLRAARATRAKKPRGGGGGGRRGPPRDPPEGPDDGAEPMAPLQAPRPLPTIPDLEVPQIRSNPPDRYSYPERSAQDDLSCAPEAITAPVIVSDRPEASCRIVASTPYVLDPICLDQPTLTSVRTSVLASDAGEALEPIELLDLPPAQTAERPALLTPAATPLRGTDGRTDVVVGSVSEPTDALVAVACRFDAKLHRKQAARLVGPLLDRLTAADALAYLETELPRWQRAAARGECRWPIAACCEPDAVEAWKGIRRAAGRGTARPAGMASIGSVLESLTGSPCPVAAPSRAPEAPAAPAPRPGRPEGADEPLAGARSLPLWAIDAPPVGTQVRQGWLYRCTGTGWSRVGPVAPLAAGNPLIALVEAQSGQKAPDGGGS